MSLTKRRFFAIAGPLGLLLATAAFAEDSPARQTSPEETMNTSRELLQKMQDSQGKVTKLVDQARRKKDAIKLNCVNDKLVQIKGHVSLADQGIVNLNTAVARGNDGERQHEFTRMTILYQKVLVLGTEAENCVGEEPSYVGATNVQVEIDPSVPDDDPTEPQLPLPDVTRPPEASPFN